MKCSSCGSILSYNDKYCKQCGAPPEQDYEPNKDRIVTTLIDVVKSYFQSDNPTEKRLSKPPRCGGCGGLMHLVYGNTFDTETGERKQYYECPVKTAIKLNYKRGFLRTFARYNERVEYNRHDSDVPFDEFEYWLDFTNADG